MGDPSAAEQLLPLVYDELRKLAAAKLGVLFVEYAVFWKLRLPGSEPTAVANIVTERQAAIKGHISSLKRFLVHPIEESC